MHRKVTLTESDAFFPYNFFYEKICVCFSITELKHNCIGSLGYKLNWVEMKLFVFLPLWMQNLIWNTKQFSNSIWFFLWIVLTFFSFYIKSRIITINVFNNVIKLYISWLFLSFLKTNRVISTITTKNHTITKKQTHKQTNNKKKYARS